MRASRSLVFIHRARLRRERSVERCSHYEIWVIYFLEVPYCTDAIHRVSNNAQCPMPNAQKKEATYAAPRENQ